MPLAVFIVARPVWGWSVRVPYTSVGGASYPLPPPTTVVGALAEPLAELLGWPELEAAGGGGRAARRPSLRSPAARLAEHVVAVGAGLAEGAVITSYDLVRTENVPYLKTQHQRDPGQWFSVNAFGVTYSPGSRLCLAIVFDDGARRLAGEELLLRAALGVARIGSKEGLVSVEYAGVTGRVERVEDAETRLYAPCGVAAEEVVSVRAASPRSAGAWGVEETAEVEEVEICMPLEEPVPGVYVGRDMLVREAYRLAFDSPPDVPEPCLVVPGGWG